MWRSEGKRSGYLYAMRRLCSDRSDSRVLLSTRDQQVSEEVDGDNYVKFREPDKETSIRMLHRYGCKKEQGISDFTKSSNECWQYVLRTCVGLPVALGVAEKAIGRIARQMSGEDRQEVKVVDAVVEYSRKLEQSSITQKELGERGQGEHEVLSAALHASMPFAGVSEGKERKGRMGGNGSGDLKSSIVVCVCFRGKGGDRCRCCRVCGRSVRRGQKVCWGGWER